MIQVEGKTAFITGGSSGIGLGIAKAFVDAGMSVAIGYRTPAHLEEAMRLLAHARNQVHAIRIEVTDRPGLERAAAEVVDVFGKIHVLVNNAGMQNPSSLSQMTYDEWDSLMNVNVNGVFNGIRAFLPRIRQHGDGGHVITTASIIGLFTVRGGLYGAYSASKFAAVAMMESLRSELAQSNIGVSVLCPGPVKSNLEPFLKDDALASDPLEIGRLVLRGMKRDDLYILTHPEFNPFIQCRHDALLASTPTDVTPKDDLGTAVKAALQMSIYSLEHARLSGLRDQPPGR